HKRQLQLRRRSHHYRKPEIHMVTTSIGSIRGWVCRRATLLRCATGISIAVAGIFFMAGASNAEILLQDATGRDVRLSAPAERIVTNESLLLYSLALIDTDPVKRIAGW